MPHRVSTFLRVVLLLLGALALLPAPAASAPDDRTAPRPVHVTAETREGRLRIFDDVWETVRDLYYDPALRGLDWEGLRAKYRPEAASAAGPEELYAVLRRMLAHLSDPHTRVYEPGRGTDWRETRHVAVGVQLRELSGEIVVARVERDSPAARAGVRAGDTLLSIDGAPVSQLLARRSVEGQAGAAPHVALHARARAPANGRTRLVASLFDGPEGSTFEAVFRDEGGRERVVRLTRELVARTPALSVRRASGAYRVVEFNLFTQEIAAGMARAFKGELKGARGLVLDLRDNGGGDAEAMTDIASLLLPPNLPLGRFDDRAGRPRLEPRTRAALLSAADAPARFSGPVVVLTGARTASAAEVFAAALRESGRAARVVGETTCGCVLGIRRRHTLPDGGTLDVSEMDYRTAAGQRLEGSGVEPDELLTPTRRSLREGKDPALARAVEILREAGGKRPNAKR